MAQISLPPKYIQPIKPAQLLESQSRFEDVKGLDIHELGTHLDHVLAIISRATEGRLLPFNLADYNEYHADRTATIRAAAISAKTVENIDISMQALLDSALVLSYQILDIAKPKPDKRSVQKGEEETARANRAGQASKS